VRENKHFYLLDNGKHTNCYLQHSFNLHGKDNFIFDVLEYCKKENLILREQFWIDSYKIRGEVLYNICLVAGSSLGRGNSAETRMKISKSNLGRKASEETKEKMRKAHFERGKGTKRSEESKQKQRESLLGRKLSEETKQKIRVAGLGRKPSEETRRKLGIARRGRKHTEESKLKMREATLRQWEVKRGKSEIIKAKGVK
jgi:group I intron endonuclease